MASIAIIGTGIAGMGCAHFLHGVHEVTLFEKDGHVGGHSNTVTAEERGSGRELAIDTGFMVFNRVTYPNLCRLFGQLAVPVKKTDMSFGVRDESTGIEWCGSSLNHLFAQRRNLVRWRFVRMLVQVDRFNREAVGALADPAMEGVSLREYVAARGYGRDFLDLYLTPMSSAVWSTPPALMLDFPALTLLRFFHNHGFLGLHTQHQWWTVDGGSREYVKRLIAPWHDRIQRGVGAVSVRRERGAVVVDSSDGQTRSFDQVVIATHADQALRLLADPTGEEQRCLSVFRYQANLATLHTDATVMPKARLAWASWNYQIAGASGGGVSTATHYWMNRLQGVSERENYFVTIDRPESIAEDRVIRRIAYEHPLFDRAAVAAQKELPILNQQALGGTRTFFAGSYFRYGFHEDALASAVSLSSLLLGRDAWSTSGAAVREAALA